MKTPLPTPLPEDPPEEDEEEEEEKNEEEEEDPEQQPDENSRMQHGGWFWAITSCKEKFLICWCSEEYCSHILYEVASDTFQLSTNDGYKSANIS